MNCLQDICYYERALAEIKSSTTEALRKFYEGDGSYPLLHQPKTLSNLVSLANFGKMLTIKKQNVSQIKF